MEKSLDIPSMPTLVIGLLVALFMFPTIHYRMSLDAPLWAKVVMYSIAILVVLFYAANIGFRIYYRIDRKRKGLD